MPDTTANNRTMIHFSHRCAEWEQVPKGLCLLIHKLDNHAEPGVFIHFKHHDGPWFDQPAWPSMASYCASKESHSEFWQWAAENLPVWDRDGVLKGESNRSAP